jgi:hypothetical protein
MWFWPEKEGWDWPNEGWLEQLQMLGIEASHISAVVKYIEIERMRSLAATQWPKRWVPLAMQIMEERGRQLTTMTDAMGRFVEAVFPS